MKTENIFMSAAMLAVFLLATLSLVIRLVQFVVETVQTILVAILFVSKIACKMVKVAQHLLSSFDWLLSAIQGIFDAIHSSLEGWMVSTVPSDPTDDRPTPILTSANPFPSERTAFEESAITSLEVIAQHKPAIVNSLESAVAPTKALMLTPAETFPSEKTAFEYHAISAIVRSLELAIAKPIEVITKPLGKVITIGESTELIPLSLPGVYVQRTPKKKPTKSELSKLTAVQLRDRMAEVAKNNSLVVPKSYEKAKKAVLVDWLMAN